MLKNLLILFLISLLFLACNKEKEVIQQNYTLKKTESLVLKLDSVTSIKAIKHPQWFKDKDNGYLCFINTYNNTIYFMDIEKQKTTQFIELASEGPDNVGYAQGFYIQSMDSIFIYSQNYNILSLVNKKGEILKKYNLYEKGSKGLAIPTMSQSSPAVKIGESMYFNLRFGMAGKKYPEHEIKAKMNLNTGKMIHLPFLYPETYKKNYYGIEAFPNFGYFFHTFNPDNEQFVYSFAATDSIYVTDRNHQTVKSYLANSQYFDKVKPTNSAEIEAQTKAGYEDFFFYFSRPDYHAIIYDQFQDVYYRIAKHPISQTELDLKDPLKSRTKAFSVIILDNQFKKVGEYLFPRFQYSPWLYFVNEKGLHFAKESENEDESIFDVFKLEKNEI